MCMFHSRMLYIVSRLHETMYVVILYIHFTYDAYKSIGIYHIFVPRKLELK